MVRPLALNMTLLWYIQELDMMINLILNVWEMHDKKVHWCFTSEAINNFHSAQMLHRGKPESEVLVWNAILDALVIG